MDWRRLLGLALVLGGLGLSLGNFLNWLSPGMDLAAKVLTYAMLVGLWYEFDLPENVFGREDWTLNKLILLAFYVLAFKHVVTIWRSAPAAVTLAGGLVVRIPALSAALTRTLMLGSIAAGQVLLNLVCAYIAVAVAFTRPGVMHSVAHIVLRALSHVHPVDAEEAWDMFARSPLDEFRAGRSPSFLVVLARFLATYYILLGFFAIVFDTITQWMVAAVDRALFLVSVMYVLHFSEHLSASELSGRIDDFERGFIFTVARLFNTPSLFHLGLSALLVTRCLADAGYFLIPYVIGSELDPFYMMSICAPTERGLTPSQVASREAECERGHAHLLSILDEEGRTRHGLDLAATVALYGAGVAGVFVLLSMPVAIWLMMVTGAGEEAVARIKRLAPLLGVLATLAVAFLLNPWVTAASIDPATGISGVDLRTQPITDATTIAGVAVPLDVPSLLTLTLSLVLGSIALGRRRRWCWLICLGLFSLSMLYLTDYTVLYGASEVRSYVATTVGYASAPARSVPALTRALVVKFFADMMVVSAAFYLGTLPLFLYHASVWALRNFVGPRGDGPVLAWMACSVAALAFVLLARPQATPRVMLLVPFLYVAGFASLGYRAVLAPRLGAAMEGFAAFLLLLLVNMLSSLGVNYLLLRSGAFGPAESAIAASVASHALVFALAVPYLPVVARRLGESDRWPMRPWPSWSWGGRAGEGDRSFAPSLLAAAALGLGFGLALHALGERVAPLPPGYGALRWTVLLAGLTALSEELWFRGVLFRSLSGAFPFGASCVLQAAAFAVAHVAKGVSAPVFLVLASFAVAAAWLLHRTRSLGPPVALHFAANLVLIGASYGTLPMPGG